MEHLNWNWPGRYERWLKTSVGYVLGPVAGLIVFSRYAAGLLPVLFLSASTVGLRLLRPRVVPNTEIKSAKETNNTSGNREKVARPDRSGAHRRSIKSPDRPRTKSRSSTRPGTNLPKSRQPTRVGPSDPGRIASLELQPPQSDGVLGVVGRVIGRRLRGNSAPNAGASPEILSIQFKRDLKLCATANAVAVLIDETIEGGGYIPDIVEHTLRHLFQIGTDRDETKQVLENFGLVWVIEGPDNEREIKLRCDPATGTISWNDKAVSHVLFEHWRGRELRDILSGRPTYRVSIRFNKDDKLTSWMFLRRIQVI